ncbi:MAG: LTA synthase family protein [Bacilli bacterium]
MKHKTIINNIKKYTSTNILFISYCLCAVVLDIILRGITGSSIFSIRPILTDAAFVIMIGSFGYLLKPKNQIKYFFTLTFMFMLLCTINAVYYEFYESYASFNLISTLPMIEAVDDSVYQKIHFSQFIYLFFPFILLIIHKVLKKQNYYVKNSEEKRKKMFKYTFFTGLLFTILLFASLKPSDYSRLLKQWNREYLVHKMGIYIYQANDIIQSVQPKINTMFGFDKDYKTFRDFYDKKAKEKITTNKYTNVFKGKNVIFIHGESIQTFLIDLKIGDKEVTPNLNKLAKKSMYFSKFYPQISVGTSSDTEFTLSTGLMPSSSGTVFVSYSNVEYDTMQKYLKDNGYFIYSMHGNKADYWNRKVMHKSLGYDKFYAKDFYNVTPENTIGLGISDKAFFEQSIPEMKKIKEEHSPFMSTIITLSNHSSFNHTDKYGMFDVSMKYNDPITNEEKTAPYLEGTYMGDYLKSVRYADEALGEFIEALDKEGILDNTVFIFYGDHEARLSKNQFELLYNYDPIKDDLKDKTDPSYISFDNYGYDMTKNTPLIIYSKDNNIAFENKDIMGMYDILPTLANMFGFKEKYSLGHDIYSNHEKIAIFPNGDFITNKVYCGNLKNEYVLLDDKPIDTNYIKRLKEYTNERLNVSNAIIYHDLIKYSKGKEEK